MICVFFFAVIAPVIYTEKHVVHVLKAYCKHLHYYSMHLYQYKSRPIYNNISHEAKLV